MKATHIIPPAAAFLIVVAWNASQMRSISALERSGASLREEISKADTGKGLSANSVAHGQSSRQNGTRQRAVDWKKLSGNISDASDGGSKSSIRALVDFQKRLAAMTRDELIAALDDIDAQGLSEEERGNLEELILAALIKQDPQYALERFIDRIESEPDGIGSQLSSALEAWSKKDKAAAIAWFDRQIAEGKFESKTLDGRSEMRAEFEASIMESLVGSDLDAAGKRLAALPEDQRREVLEQLTFTDLSPEEQMAYATLVRQLVPGDERAGAFAHIASELAEDGSYGKVSSFLDSVNATAEERSAAAVQTAESKLSGLAEDGKVTQGEIDSLRGWLNKQAPGKADGITGKALAEAAQEGGEFGFTEASQLALHYQKTSGSDEVLISFLKSYSARSNLEEARHLAEMISDEKIRGEILGGMD